MPMPPVGGMPYSRAVMKSSSTAICTCQSIVIVKARKDKISHVNRLQTREGSSISATLHACKQHSADSEQCFTRNEAHIRQAQSMHRHEQFDQYKCMLANHIPLSPRMHLPLHSHSHHDQPGTQHAAQGHKVHCHKVTIDDSMYTYQAT